MTEQCDQINCAPDPNYVREVDKDIARQAYLFATRCIHCEQGLIDMVYYFEVEDSIEYLGNKFDKMTLREIYQWMIRERKLRSQRDSQE